MSNGLRWWDGGTWSGYTARARHPAIPQEANERSLLLWAKAYPVSVVLFTVVAMALSGSALSSVHHYFHEYDHWLHAITTAHQNGQPVPNPPSASFSASVYVLDLVELPLLGVFIVFLVWVYRAALVARSLAYPAPWSPGWSVAVWLIPVVNLWMPAQVLRSLLPAGHPARARVWVGWVVYLLAIVLGGVGVGVLIWGSIRSVGWVVLGCGDAGSVIIAYLLFRYIGIVGQQHQQAVEAWT
jgi:hypothetical protein